MAEYGTAIPNEVTLGGQLYFVHQQAVNGQVNESSVEDTIKAAVSVKVGGAEGSASFSSGSGSSARTTAQSIADSQRFTVMGGDSTLASAPQKWPNTVKDPRLWAVIRRSGLRSTLDLLDDDLRKQALEVWDRVPPMILPTEDLPVENRSAQYPPLDF